MHFGEWQQVHTPENGYFLTFSRLVTSVTSVASVFRWGWRLLGNSERLSEAPLTSEQRSPNVVSKIVIGEIAYLVQPIQTLRGIVPRNAPGIGEFPEALLTTGLPVSPSPAHGGPQTVRSGQGLACGGCVFSMCSENTWLILLVFCEVSRNYCSPR